MSHSPDQFISQSILTPSFQTAVKYGNVSESFLFYRRRKRDESD